MTDVSHSGRVRVFISYSHDSDEHARLVLELAQELRRNGIDVWIDQFEDQPPRDWTAWMRTKIDHADFVLVVATPTYKRRAEDAEPPHVGRGVRWEASVISQELYNSGLGEPTRFIPVLLEPARAEDIPYFLAATTHYSLPDLTNANLEPLLRRITRQPAVLPQPLGAIPTLPPLPGHETAKVSGPIESPHPEALGTIPSLPAVSGSDDVFQDFGIIKIFSSRAARIREEYDTRLQKAQDGVDIFGFGLRAFREDYATSLPDLSKRVPVRVLLLDPSFPGSDWTIAGQRDREESNPTDTIASDVTVFAKTFADAISNSDSRLEVRLYRCLPMINVFRIDDELFWGPYLIGEQSRNSPTMLVRRGGTLYTQMMAHYNQIWNRWAHAIRPADLV